MAQHVEGIDSKTVHHVLEDEAWTQPFESQSGLHTWHSSPELPSPARYGDTEEEAMATYRATGDTSGLLAIIDLYHHTLKSQAQRSSRGLGRIGGISKGSRGLVSRGFK
jgi:hypothetical protein